MICILLFSVSIWSTVLCFPFSLTLFPAMLFALVMKRVYRPLFLNDPNVSALISELGLVPGPMPKDWILHCKTPLFCDVVKRHNFTLAKDRAQLCRELYLRNRKHSRYVRRSYSD